MLVLTGEVLADFHVLANEVSALNNNCNQHLSHSLPLACLVLTWTIT